MKRVTIKDIAKLTNVSRGTVDRVINNRGKVSKDVEKRVLQIAKELNYRKNILASRLASTKTHRIVIVVPDESCDIFWELPKKGMDKAIDSIKDYGIIVEHQKFNLFDKEEFKSVFKKAIDSLPDIIILAPLFMEESLALLEYSQEKNVPIITFNSELEHKNILSYIGQNSYKSGYLVGKLINMGLNPHDEIIILNLAHKVTNAPHYTGKYQGLIDYFKDNNLNERQIYLYDVKFFRDETKLKSFFEKIKKKHPNLKFLFFTNSRAYKLLNILDDDEIQKYVIIGFDTIAPNVKLLKEGKIDFLINQNPIQQGFKTITISLDYLIHKKISENKQYLPLDIVVKENVEFYINETIL